MRRLAPMPDLTTIPCQSCGGEWIGLFAVTEDGLPLPVEYMAAHCCDGIGILARWSLQADGWVVSVIDTENPALEVVTDFHEGEPVPPEPPLKPAEVPHVR